MPVSTNDPERLAYSPAEVASALGCTRQHIQNLIARGEIPSVKLGRRRFILRRYVEHLLDVAELPENGDAACRAADDPQQLARAAKIVRRALERRELRLVDLVRREEPGSAA